MGGGWVGGGGNPRVNISDKLTKTQMLNMAVDHVTLVCWLCWCRGHSLMTVDVWVMPYCHLSHEFEELFTLFSRSQGDRKQFPDVVAVTQIRRHRYTGLPSVTTASNHIIYFLCEIWAVYFHLPVSSLLTSFLFLFISHSVVSFLSFRHNPFFFSILPSF